MVASISFGHELARHLGVFPGSGRVILELGRFQDEGKVRLIQTKANDPDGYSCRHNAARVRSRAITPLVNRFNLPDFELPAHRSSPCKILDAGHLGPGGNGAAYVVALLPQWARKPATYSEAVA